MAYYESDYYEDYYEDFDDDFDDTLVEDFDDSLGEDYEDAIVEDYEENEYYGEAPRRRPRSSRAAARRARRAERKRRRRDKRNPPPRRPAPAAKPKEVEKAFGLVKTDVNRLKAASNASTDSALVNAMSILVNSSSLEKKEVTVIATDDKGEPIRDKDGHLTTQKVVVGTNLDNKTFPQLLVLGFAYFSAKGQLPRTAPFFLLALLALLPNLFNKVTLDKELSSDKRSDVNNTGLVFDAKSMLALTALGIMLLKRRNRK